MEEMETAELDVEIVMWVSLFYKGWKVTFTIQILPLLDRGKLILDVEPLKRSQFDYFPSLSMYLMSSGLRHVRSDWSCPPACHLMNTFILTFLTCVFLSHDLLFASPSHSASNIYLLYLLIDKVCMKCESNSRHLCFKQAQPKMCHSPKVEDGIENQFFTS